MARNSVSALSQVQQQASALISSKNANGTGINNNTSDALDSQCHGGASAASAAEEMGGVQHSSDVTDLLSSYTEVAGTTTTPLTLLTSPPPLRVLVLEPVQGGVI